MNDFNNDFYTEQKPSPPSPILTAAKKTYSTIGVSVCVIIAAVYGIQFIIGIILGLMGDAGSAVLNSSTATWIISFVPLYAVAFPIGMIVLKKLPANAPENVGMTAKDFFTALPIAILLMNVGNYMGNFISLFLSKGTSENALNELAMDTGILKVIVMVLLAPLFEELFFRKYLIDRTLVYGEKTAVIFSGLIFGLFHMNLYQFFYAFFVGTLFAYVYVRSGKLRYSIMLHAVINFFGSVVAPFVISKLDLEALEKFAQTNSEQITEEMLQTFNALIPGLMLFFSYTLVWGGLAILGLILAIINRKKLTWKRSELELPSDSIAGTVYMNPGIIFFVILSVSLSLISLFAA